MMRREPTAITLGLSDVVELNELKRMYQKEEAWRIEVAKNAKKDNHEADYLFNQTMNKNAKDDNKSNNSAKNEESSFSSNTFLNKRRRIASNTTGQRRNADARKRLGVDRQQQSIYKMGRQV